MTRILSPRSGLQRRSGPKPGDKLPLTPENLHNYGSMMDKDGTVKSILPKKYFLGKMLSTTQIEQIRNSMIEPFYRKHNPVNPYNLDARLKTKKKK